MLANKRALASNLQEKHISLYVPESSLALSLSVSNRNLLNASPDPDPAPSFVNTLEDTFFLSFLFFNLFSPSLPAKGKTFFKAIHL